MGLSMAKHRLAYSSSKSTSIDIYIEQGREYAPTILLPNASYKS
jgi:hypothetical protein